MLSTNSGHFNYYEHYNTDFNDSLPIVTSPNADSVDFCPAQLACVNPQTNFYYGPLYAGHWNTGDSITSCVQHQNNDGLYFIYVNRLDGCYQAQDTIYIDYHPTPPMPLLTDDHSVNISSSQYQSIIACAPDTLNLYFQNLCPGCTATITSFESNLEEAPLVLDSTYSTGSNAGYEVWVTSEFGCRNYESFYFRLLRDIKPYLLLKDYYDRNDSIMICEGDGVEILIADSLTNPNGLLMQHEEVPSAYSVAVYHEGQLLSGSSTDGRSSYFEPLSTGWYVVHQNVTVGLNPCVYPHQVIDSFYVEVKQDGPGVSILGAELLCPDTYNVLSVSPSMPDLSWSGPGILWTSPDSDSIMLNESGYSETRPKRWRRLIGPAR